MANNPEYVELLKKQKTTVTEQYNKRVSYFKDYSDQKPALNPPFSSVYICSKMLPKQIVFEEIRKDDLKIVRKLF